MGKQVNRYEVLVTTPDNQNRTLILYSRKKIASMPQKLHCLMTFPKGTTFGWAEAGFYDYDTNAIIGGEKLEPVIEACMPSRQR